MKTDPTRSSRFVSPSTRLLTSSGMPFNDSERCARASGRSSLTQALCRAGLHLNATTVGRILKETPRSTPQKASATTGRMVTAREPNHVRHIDLTAVPTGGFLGTLAAARPTAMLAVLLVTRRGHWPLLSARNGLCGLLQAARLTFRTPVPWLGR